MRHPTFWQFFKALVSLWAMPAVLMIAIAQPASAQGIDMPKAKAKPVAKRAFFNWDKPVKGLLIVQSGAEFYDGWTTKANLPFGATEGDPFTRLFIGRRPSWKRMAPSGAAEAILTARLAQCMRESKKPWVRRLWFLPQAGLAGVHIAFAVRNARS
jgi:hypothetical protein